jgi:hypothetical protein
VARGFAFRQSGGALSPVFSSEAQRETEWCWAAVTVAVLRHYLPAAVPMQCEFVNRSLQRDDCCAAGACNEQGRLEEALALGRCLNRWAASRASFEAVQREIKSNRPLCCGISLSGGGGHFVTVSGWAITDDRWVFIHDPDAGHGWVLFDHLQSDYLGRGAWSHTYYTKRPSAQRRRGAAATALRS